MKDAFRNYVRNGSWVNLLFTAAVGVLVSYLLMQTMRAADAKFVPREVFVAHVEASMRWHESSARREDQLSQSLNELSRELSRLNGYLEKQKAINQ